MSRRIAFLLFADFQLLDAAGPIAAFEIAEDFQPGSYELRVVAKAPGAVASTSGATMNARALPRPAAIDTLVIVGGDGSRAASGDARLVQFIARCGARSRRVASVCSGAYLLAATGLLDGRAATTHWSRGDDFARRYPRVRVDADRIFVRSGRFWTSAGISAGIDLALALIAEDLGESLARRVARELVVYYRRPGGQSQFSTLLELERADGRFAPLLDFIRRNLESRLNVQDLAAQACMSPRNFARAFRAETGASPAKAVMRLRAETARAQLERGGQSIRQVAKTCGFGDPERMRRAFVSLFGRPPSALR
ncbi:MAG TPA: GlxA family transcriptional regulator [Steroidobacteraceae bacterium]|jgi:transcriptional regulator GlxA family with amidase domain|nr:GlxA family transcriptional regulator [Steroidobacteraceae bacterium]